MNEPQTFVDLQDAGNAQAQLILQAVARHADWNTGVCWPGEDAIAKMAKCSTRTVRTYLARLEHDGLITREDRRSEGGVKLRKIITLVGYEEWIGALRQGGKVAKPKAVSKYEQPAESLSGGPEENLSGTIGSLSSGTIGNIASGTKEHSLNIKSNKSARAREDSKIGLGSEVVANGYSLTKSQHPEELAAWRRYALHKQGHAYRIIVRHIDDHGFAVVPSVWPPDQTLTDKSKRMSGDAA